MFVPSLPGIAAEFQADYGLVNLSVAGYAAMTAALQLIMGPLSDRFGRRPVILATLAVFIAASLGCLLAGDIWTFLVFRLLQGAIITGYAVSLAVIRATAPAPKETGRASCRERVCKYVSLSVVPVSLKKKIQDITTT